jgi:hypothetical protein
MDKGDQANTRNQGFKTDRDISSEKTVSKQMGNLVPNYLLLRLNLCVLQGAFRV